MLRLRIPKGLIRSRPSPCRKRKLMRGWSRSVPNHFQELTQHIGKEHQSLKMKCTAAPFLGSDIGDGLRKVPAVAVKVLSVVLALAIGLVLGFRQDDGTVLSRSFAVPLSIFDANLNDVRVVGYRVAFGDGEAAITGFHLDAVVGDSETDGEAKSL